MDEKVKNKIIKEIQDMPFCVWRSLEDCSQEKRDYIIWLCQNQRGSSLEANGISYQPETHTRFRKIDTSYRK